LARRAGLVGGVVSAFALSGAAAPAMADNTHHSARHLAAARDAPAAAPLSTAATARQAVAAMRQTADTIEQNAIAASLTAARQRAAADALRTAAEAKRAADAKAAAARAATERAAAQAAASRSAQRTALHVTASASSASSSATTASTTAAPTSSSKVDQLIAFLKSQVGKPYVYGATGPGSYDCSGLTQAAFASVGVSLPRTSQEQSTVGTPVSLSALRPGDLIFWGGEGSAFHVAVYIGNGQYLDAANPSKGVVIQQMADYVPDWAVRVL
jgi:cell wall-associated NlpC family hydrolase